MLHPSKGHAWTSAHLRMPHTARAQGAGADATDASGKVTVTAGLTVQTEARMGRIESKLTLCFQNLMCHLSHLIISKCFQIPKRGLNMNSWHETLWITYVFSKTTILGRPFWVDHVASATSNRDRGAVLHASVSCSWGRKKKVQVDGFGGWFPSLLIPLLKTFNG